MRKINYLILLILISIYLANASESIFGISDKSLGFLQPSYSSSGMARSYEIASKDSLQINFRNFSLWSDIANTTYTLKAGYNAAFSEDRSKTTYFNDFANFQGGFIAAPLIKHKLAFGMGLQPISFMEQRIINTIDPSDDQTINEHLLIKGGLSRASINFSYKFHPNIGIGLGFEYNFGKITDKIRMEFIGTAESTVYYDYDYCFYGNGFVLSAFTDAFNNFTFGLMIRPPADVNVRIRPNSSSEEVNKSELINVTLPAEFNFGVEYRLSNRVVTGLDLIYQDWKNGYKVEGSKVSDYQDAYFRIGAGIERKTSEKRFTKLSEKIDYRLGVFYGKLNQKSQMESVNEYGLSLGFSLPLQRFRSRIDFAGIVGKRGNLSRNAFEETFISFGITFCASEIWFVNIDD